MSNQAFLDRVAKRIVRGPFGQLMDMRIELVEQDHAIVRLPVRPEVSNGGGIVHGGATAALIDTAATAAAWATPAAGEGSRGTTVGFTVNFLAPGRDGSLRAEARVVQRGGSLTVLDVMVTGGDGQAIAKAQVTYKLKHVN